jgi:formyl-CoA transferase
LNAGARSIVLDSRSSEWRPVVDALIRTADVVIVGGRPRSARARGIDFEAVRKLAPEIIYCSVTGFGDEGPWRDNAAHGLNPDAWAGIVPLEMDSGYPAPPESYLSHGTPLAGLFAALGIMGALFNRAKAGTAQFVSISLWSAAMWWNWRDINLQLNLGEGRESYGALGARYATYATADGRAVMICPIEQKFWVAFCADVGLQTLAEKGRWESAHVDYGSDDERPLIAARIAEHPLAHWIEVFTKSGIPFAPVLTALEAVRSQQAKAAYLTRSFMMNDVPVEVMASPVRVTTGTARTAPRDLGPPPKLGEDTEALLAELGLRQSSK